MYVAIAIEQLFNVKQNSSHLIENMTNHISQVQNHFSDKWKVMMISDKLDSYS